MAAASVAPHTAGCGLPYGNSTVMPYVRQFFVGHQQRARVPGASVGPGTYTSDPNSTVLIDQAGDIHLEMNAEYRFTLSGYFKGAVFADAGNIWLVNDDPQRPGGKFEWANVPSELAVGAGFGLRFDPGMIVVRLDLATPLRVALPAGDRWVFDDRSRGCSITPCSTSRSGIRSRAGVPQPARSVQRELLQFGHIRDAQLAPLAVDHALLLEIGEAADQRFGGGTHDAGKILPADLHPKIPRAIPGETGMQAKDRLGHALADAHRRRGAGAAPSPSRRGPAS
jgi:hypothetical protein